MKRVVWSLAVLGSVAFLAWAEDKKASEASTETVLRLEQRWEDALTKSDTAALGEIYDETLIYTHSNGKVDTKSTYINAIQSGATRYESMKRDDIQFKVYEQAAVVSCHWKAHVVSRGNPIDLDARYLHVYIQQPGGWKMVAHQSTRLTP